ncbi:MAG: L-threonylcarbamoyladenylate synthase [Egibacteraceae bacterium]
MPADAEGVRQAAAVLRGGGLVAFPTETVYGLGSCAWDAEAARRVFDVKGRPADNPLIVHVADHGGLAEVAAAVSPLARRLAARFWPGPLTVVVEAVADLPPVTTAGLATVGVRMPAHPAALALLQAAGVPVAAPSANRSGRPSPTTAAHVLDDLGGQVDVVLDGGPCEVGVESTVVDARGCAPVVLREGAVSREQLGLGAGDGEADLAASPGTRHRHYAPRCRVEIAPAGLGPASAAALASSGVQVGLVAPGEAGPPVRQLARFCDAAELGRLLYRALRAAEDAGVDVVVVEAVDPAGIGRAVMDRLRRAAAS